MKGLGEGGPVKWDTILTETQIETDLAKYVKDYDYVSFAELQRRYGDQMKGASELYLNAENNLAKRNIILWGNLSSAFCKALQKSLDDGVVHFHTCESLVYLMDGIIPELPVVHHIPPKQGYAKKHWLPVVLRHGPFCGAKECPHNVKRK